MQYSHILLIEKVFLQFLTKQKRKKIITVKYYKRRGKDFSFIGYVTNNEGLYGIHYELIGNNFHFGENNRQTSSALWGLTYPQRNRIPKELKDHFFDVATNKINKKTSILNWVNLY